ncbi:putative ribonuclease H-like domain-containing protein [Tanacetum coccineum]|uniref:Ribonuclease H-like domain-containing protein n=1 Tax=Tanacetum coccineum TaxID=301880 RepID=A0ABQ5FTV3_9ASTR
MAGSEDDIPPPPPPPSQTPTQQTPHTVSTIKLPILKKGQYDIWTMKMEYCLAHTDYPIWDVIQRGTGPKCGKLSNLDLVEMINQRRCKNVSTEDANQKFLRSLPSAWSQVSLIMKTKPRVDSLSFDDMYNNLRVFESDVKGSTASSSSTQNVAFVSENTSSTNDVSTSYGVSNSSGHPSSYSLLANQSSCPQLDHEDLEQLDEFDLEEMDLKWQVAMISMRMKKFYINTGRKLQFDAKEPVGFNKTKVECYSCHKIGHFARECKSKGNQDSRRRHAWNTRNKDKENRRRSGKHEDSKALVTLDGEAVQAQTQSQMSARDKAGLGYGDQMNKGVLSYENEVFQSVFVSRTSDIEDSPVNDRYAEGMHAVPPLMTGIYIPSGPDKEIDDSQFTYGPKQSKPSESDARSSDFNTCESNCSEETHESMPEPVVNEPKVVSQPKVWFDSQIIEEYELDSEDKHVSLPIKEQETPSFAFINTVKHVKLLGKLLKNKTDVAVPTNAARKVNTIKPIVNNARPKAGFHKTLSPFRKPFNRTTALRTNFSYQKVNTAEVNAVSAVGGKRETAVKPSAGCNWRHKRHYWNKVSKYNGGSSSRNYYPQRDLQNKGIVDSGCSRHMTGNKAYLAEYQDFNGGPVAFGGSKGYITGKGKIKTGKLDFEDVCFVKELQHFNLFSVSQMCDKKNKVLFTDSECLVLSPEFKLPDENQVLLRIPRQNNMYSFNLENIVPSGGLACLIAKATIDESNKWHRRLGHVNFKNLNKLVKGNLVRGLPSKIFQNDHTCVACQKGKQHKASCKAKSVSSISQPLQLMHMDLFGPTSVRILNHKTYCLVITDDFIRFSWVFFLKTKDETSGIFKDFITQIKNQLNQKVKSIRCDNGKEFKNRDFIKFCGSKGIKREYSNARTPQQNGVVERKNRTLIETARTMLADSFLPKTFWAEAVSTACYVLNRFDGKSDEGFLVGYSLQSKAFKVYNLKTKRVEENLHITILENKPNVAGKGPTWLFDLDYLTDSMNYQPVRSENQANKHAGPKEANHNVGTKDNIDAGDSEIEAESAQDYFVLPIWSSYTSTVKSSKAKNAGEEPNKNPDLKTDEKPVDKEDQVFLDELERLKRQEQDANDAAEALRKEFAQDTEDLLLQAGAAKASSTNTVNTASTPVSTASPYGGLSFTDLTNTDQDDSEMPALEDVYDNSTDGIFTNASYDDEGAVADFTNLETIVNFSPIPTSRITPSILILGDHKSVVQTRSKVTKSSGAHAFIHVDLPYGKKAIGTKWVYRNKKDERGVVVRNKARLVAQGHRQEEGIDYDEVFPPMARIKAIRIFLTFASYMGFKVYQMDVKSAFLYGKIDEEVYVSQPLGFVDPKYPKKVYKVVKALYGLHQAPRAWYATLSTFLLKNGYRRGTIDKTLFIKKDKNDIMLVQVYVDDIILDSTKRSWCDEFEALMKSRFQMSSMGELTFFLGLQVKQKEDGIFISQDKYVAEILKKFDFASVKTASTPIETQKPLVKDEEASDVDVHLYRSMIGSLMYLTASRPDIMFAVCACSRFQVTPKTSHLNAVKRIFRYLKGKPKLGLWYPRVSSFDLEAYSDSDYVGANLDRKSTIGGCQFLGRRLISWQCKKQTIVATSTTEAEYVAAANCCGQVLWIQNQMLDYGFNFMNTKIYIDNESTICIVKNPIFHSKTKHIGIRHHFIRDAYKKKLIQVLKIHTDDNVADLLTKSFDVSKFQFLVVTIGMINP